MEGLGSFRNLRLACQECLLGGGQLRTVIAAREQMAVTVRRHLDRGVPQARLHHLERQFEPAIDAAVDAPRRIEVAQAVQAPILCAPTMLVGDAGGDLDRNESTPNDVEIIGDFAVAIRKRRDRDAPSGKPASTRAALSPPSVIAERLARPPPTWGARSSCTDRPAGGHEARRV
jgi:hypothetical protein